jgi:flagellar biosynthesis protein FlhF
MKQALEEIKKDLGPDAFILSSKEVKPKKILGVFGRRFFEVTAAVDRSRPDDPLDKSASVDIDKTQDHVQLSKAAAQRVSISQTKNAAPESSTEVVAPVSPPEVKVVLDEIRSLRSLIQSMPSNTQQSRAVTAITPREFSPTVYRETYHDLLSMGLNEELVRELLNQAMNKGKGKAPPCKIALKRRIAMRLSRRIKVVKDLIKERPTRRLLAIALIGPTGVGKTTTLAKLAARAVLEDQLDVALITLDTFRIAAVEQLKTYAEIIGVPAKVVESVSQMNTAIASYSSKDLILIDTAGRSPRELSAQPEVAQYFSQSPLIHKSLVLSATTKERDLADVSKRYEAFGLDSLIVTKLDETELYGTILNEVVRMGNPLAYVTVGQNVPRDILSPNPTRLVNLALGFGNYGWESFMSESLRASTPCASSRSRSIELSVGAR